MRGLVWGFTFNDGRHKLEEIEQNYNHIGIKTVKKVNSLNTCQIELDNGDFWKVAQYSESSLGLRANISYVDIRIDPRFVETVIRHSTYLPPYNAIHYFYPPRDCWPGDEEIEAKDL